MLGFHVAGYDLVAVAVEYYRLADMPGLIAIPLFTLAGYVLGESGAPKRLVRVSESLLGWLPGGLAIVALVTCAFFTAFTGASGVTITHWNDMSAVLRVRERVCLALAARAGPGTAGHPNRPGGAGRRV